MPQLTKGTAVRYFPSGYDPAFEMKARRPPWRIERYYGKGVYLIGSKTEFVDIVHVSALRVSGRKKKRRSHDLD